MFVALAVPNETVVTAVATTMPARVARNERNMILLVSGTFGAGNVSRVSHGASPNSDFLDDLDCGESFTACDPLQPSAFGTTYGPNGPWVRPAEPNQRGVVVLDSWPTSTTQTVVDVGPERTHVRNWLSRTFSPRRR